MNQCIIVGKVKKINIDDKVASILLEVKRPYSETEFDTEYDDIRISLSEHLCNSIAEYIKEGATLGVKARIQSKTIAFGEDAVATHEIIAEKITFITAKEK